MEGKYAVTYRGIEKKADSGSGKIVREISTKEELEELIERMLECV